MGQSLLYLSFYHQWQDETFAQISLLLGVYLHANTSLLLLSGAVKITRHPEALHSMDKWLSHDMVFFTVCPVYACRVRGKGGAREIFQTATKGMPRDEFLRLNNNSQFKPKKQTHDGAVYDNITWVRSKLG